MFNLKGLLCRWNHKTAESKVQTKLHGQGEKITELSIEKITYLDKGHLSEAEVKKWAADILEDTDTNPDLWQK